MKGECDYLAAMQRTVLRERNWLYHGERAGPAQARAAMCLARLLDTGWQSPWLAPYQHVGALAALASLARTGATLRRRYERICSYQWANTPEYLSATDRLERYAYTVANALRVEIEINDDPRGTCIIVNLPGFSCPLL